MRWMLVAAILLCAAGCTASSAPPAPRTPSPGTVASVDDATAREAATKRDGKADGRADSGDGQPAAETTPEPTPESTPDDSDGRKAAAPEAGGPDLRTPAAESDEDTPWTVRNLPGYYETRARTNPEGRGSVEAGRRLFATSCQPCHGARGEGAPGLNPAMNVQLRSLAIPAEYRYGASDADIYRAIMYGFPRSPMGALKGQLSESDAWALVAYVKSLQKTQ